MKYTAIAERDGKYWFIRVPKLGKNPAGLPTQARHLSEVEAMARDLIAVYLDVPEDSFDVDLQIELPEAARKHLDNAHRLADEAAEALTNSARARRQAAMELKALGMTVRDIGAALGVSHQRAQQLLTNA